MQAIDGANVLHATSLQGAWLMPDRFPGGTSAEHLGSMITGVAPMHILGLPKPHWRQRTVFESTR